MYVVLMSQGMLGYHIQQAIGDELRKRKIYKSVATVVTQVIVDKKDEGFKKSYKTHRTFYSEEEGKALKEKGILW